LNMDKIILDGMEFYGFHGLYPEERVKGQKFQVNIILELPLAKAGRQDCIDWSVNYSEVFCTVKHIVEGSPKNLLESVAEEIAAQILGKYSVHQVTVFIRKPDVAIRGANLKYAGVSIQRQLPHEEC